MKASEVYKLPVLKEDTELWELNEHVYELDLTECDTDKNDKVILKYHADPYIDGYRVWQLFSVWYDGKPVMICQRAGRSGRDFKRSFITDIILYQEMLKYILDLFDLKNDTTLNIIELDEDRDDIDTFRGSTIEKADASYRQHVKPEERRSFGENWGGESNPFRNLPPIYYDSEDEDEEDE